MAGGSQERKAGMLSSSRLARASPVHSELAAAAREQTGFKSARAVASALALVNEAEDAAELRDSRGGGAVTSPPRPRPSPGLVSRQRPRPQRRGNEVE